MYISLKAIYRFITISIRQLKASSIEPEKIILKFIWNYKRPEIGKAIMRKKRAGRIIGPDFRLYYKATIIKTV